MCWTNSRNIDLLACRAMHGRGFTGRLARCFRHSDSDKSENDHKSVRGRSKDLRGEAPGSFKTGKHGCSELYEFGTLR
jgi:hypothetical protein